MQHILASTLTHGSTVVWDLKRQKPVISFKDPNRWGEVWEVCVCGGVRLYKDHVTREV